MIFLAGCAGNLGPTSLVLADVCALLGRTEEAVRHYDDATAFAEVIGATLWAARAKEQKAKLGAASVAPPRSTAGGAAVPPSIALEREGEMWTLRAGQETWHLKPSKGLAYLATLLTHPHEELHVAQLVGAGDEATGDAGPMLDETAKEAYRRRAGDLRVSLEEAIAHGDVGREARIREELEALAEELARAVGLGGRDRKAASDVERMRVNVQRRLKDAIDRVRAQSPAIGRYLDASVRTGSFCSYAPAWTGKVG
jgi:non-specific serine/threonine protein kinase